MKIASTIARYLLGLMFAVFGLIFSLNEFFHFFPAAPPKAGLAGQFMGALAASHYMAPVFLLQAVSGILFLINRYVPLALVLIGPVLVNILLFHLLMDRSGMLPGIAATICWLIVFYSVRPAFAGIFQPRAQQL